MEIVAFENSLPKEINNKILKFLSHPTAGIIKNTIDDLFRMHYNMFYKNEFKSIHEYFLSIPDYYYREGSPFYYKFKYCNDKIISNGLCRECGLNGRRLDYDSLYLNHDESIINGVCLQCINKNCNAVEDYIDSE